MLRFALLLLIFSCTAEKKMHSHNKKFLDPKMDPKLWMQRFESEKRDVYKNRAQVVEQMNLEQGMKVADIGAGTGAFLPLISEKIGDKGVLYAQEISSKFVEFLQKRVEQDELKNVQVIKGSAKTSNLPNNSVDLVFLCDVYHHFDHPKAMMADIKKVLKKGGRLVIVEFDRDVKKSREWILKHLDFNKEQLKEKMKAFGFTFVQEATVPFDENYMLVFSH